MQFWKGRLILSAESRGLDIFITNINISLFCLILLMIDSHCFLSFSVSWEEIQPTRYSSFLLSHASYAILMTVLHTLLNPQYTQRSNQHLNRHSKWKWVSSHLFLMDLIEQQLSKSSQHYQEPGKPTSSIDFFALLILAIGLQLHENSGKMNPSCCFRQAHLHWSMWIAHVYGYCFHFGWPHLQSTCGFLHSLFWVFTGA